LVPRAAHPPGRRAPLRVVSRSCPRRLDRRAGTRAVRRDRGPRALDGAARLGRHAHRADLGPRLLRRPGPRSIAASAAGLHDPALLLEAEPGVARKELSRLAVAQVDEEVRLPPAV